MTASCRYYSPYPKGDGEPDEPLVPSHKLYDPSVLPTRITGVNRTTSRSHGRTSDLFAGGMGRTFKAGETPTLFVCDRCFKYMTDGRTWDSHMVRLMYIFVHRLADTSEESLQNLATAWADSLRTRWTCHMGG